MTEIDGWSDEILSDLELRLKTIYAALGGDITSRTETSWAVIAHRDEQMRKKLDDGRITTDEYVRWLKGVLLSPSGEGYREEIAGEITDTNKEAILIIMSVAAMVYMENYAAYREDAIAKYGEWVAEYLPPPEDMETGGRYLPPELAIDTRRDIIYNQRLIADVILSGIMQRRAVQQIARDLDRVVRRNQSAAIRNARTNITAAENGGRQEVMDRLAQDAEIDIWKTWITMEDGRVRPSHAAMDRVTIPQDQLFVTPLGSQMMYPGDPAGVPADIYNCRCTIMITEGER